MRVTSWIRVVATSARLLLCEALLGAFVGAGVFGLFAFLTALRGALPYYGLAFVAAAAVLKFLSRGRFRLLADLDDVLGVEIYNRRTLARPQSQSFGSDCGALVFWTGRKRLERIGAMENRK